MRVRSSILTDLTPELAAKFGTFSAFLVKLFPNNPTYTGVEACFGFSFCESRGQQYAVGPAVAACEKGKAGNDENSASEVAYWPNQQISEYFRRRTTYGLTGSD